MSKIGLAPLDTTSTAGFDDLDGSIDIGSALSLIAFDPSPDVFAPVANLFVSEPAFGTFAPTLSGATINLLKIENWPALIASVNIKDLTEKLNSPTSYTVTDPKSGVSVQFLGSGFTTTTFGAYTVLATGTVTGFKMTQHGVAVASGAGYSISSGTLLGILLDCLETKSAQPILDMWFNLPTTVIGTAAIIKSSLSLLAPYVDITAVEVTGAALTVTVNQFTTYESLLNKVSGGFEIKDTVAAVTAALIVSGSALIAEAADLDSLILTNGAAALLKLTAAQDTAAASALAKIAGDAIVAVDTNGDWVTMGQGNGLTIHDIPGVDAITGGGKGETFVFAKNWGTASISDFDTHYKGVGHDFVTLAKSEFVHGAATLWADAKFTGGSEVVTVGVNSLTFSGLTAAELKTAIAAGDFKFA